MAIVYSAGSRLWHFAAINLFRASHQFLTTFPIDYLCLGIKKGQMEAFTNYVEMIFPITDHIPTLWWHFWHNFFNNMYRGKSAYHWHFQYRGSPPYAHFGTRLTFSWKFKVYRRLYSRDPLYKMERSHWLKYYVPRWKFVTSLSSALINLWRHYLAHWLALSLTFSQ